MTLLTRYDMQWSCPGLSFVSINTVKSLNPGKFEWNFRFLIFQIISVIDGWGISCEHALIWMSFDLTGDKSTLVQVMAGCRQATSHYMSQCWPRSMSPYGVTRPQWVLNGKLIFGYILVISYVKIDQCIGGWDGGDIDILNTKSFQRQLVDQCFTGIS